MLQNMLFRCKVGVGMGVVVNGPTAGLEVRAVVVRTGPQGLERWLRG